MKTVKTELLWFLIPTFVITYGFGFIAYFMGGMKNFPLMAVSMYVPAFVVISLYLFKFRKPIFKNNDLGLRFTGFKYWIIAPPLVFTLISVSFLIPFIFNNNFFDNTETILEVTEKTGLGVGSWFWNLVIIFGINTLIAPLINILMFLGEEIGWRAFLFPRLLKLYNAKVSFIIGGCIWGIWHAAGILLGLNYPNNPVLGIVMMMLMCIPLGVILQYLYFKSKNIFVPAIAHGVINWTAANFIMFLLSNEDYNKLIYGPTGIIGILIFYITAYFLFKRIDWNKANTFVMNNKR